MFLIPIYHWFIAYNLSVQCPVALKFPMILRKEHWCVVIKLCSVKDSSFIIFQLQSLIFTPRELSLYVILSSFVLISVINDMPGRYSECRVASKYEKNELGWGE